MAKKWLPVPGFIGFVTLIAGFLIQDYVLLLSKWNSITRYPVIFNFRVGTGRVLEKKFGTGRVPGSRQTLVLSATQKERWHFFHLLGTIAQGPENIKFIGSLQKIQYQCCRCLISFHSTHLSVYWRKRICFIANDKWAKFSAEINIPSTLLLY